MKRLLCAVLALILSFPVLSAESYALSDWANRNQGNTGGSQTQAGGNQTQDDGSQQMNSGQAAISLSEQKITYADYENATVGTTVIPDGWTTQVIHLGTSTESISWPNAIFLTATSPDGSAKMLFLSRRRFLQYYQNLMGVETRSADDKIDSSRLMHTADYRDAAACCDLTARTLFDANASLLADLGLSAEDQAVLADAKAMNTAAIQENVAAVNRIYDENTELLATDFTFAARTYQAGSKKITVMAYSSGYQVRTAKEFVSSYTGSDSYTEEIYWEMPCVFAISTDANKHDDYMGAFQAFALGTNVTKEYEVFCHMNGDRLITAMAEYKNGKTDSFSGMEEWEKENASRTIQTGETYRTLERWSDYTSLDGSRVKLPNAYNYVTEEDSGLISFGNQ